MERVAVHIKGGDGVRIELEAIVLPQLEQVDDLHALRPADRIELVGEPALFEQGLALAVAVASLLLDEDDLHALLLGTFRHVGDVALVLGGLVVFAVVDADGDDVDVPGLAVILDRRELPRVEKALGILPGGGHITHVPTLVDVVAEHLPPAALHARVEGVVVADGGIAADPDGRREGGVVGDLLDLDGAHGVRLPGLAGGGTDVEASVRHGDQDLVDGIVAGHVDDLEHVLHVDARAGRVAEHDLDTVQALGQVDAERGLVVGELDGVAAFVLPGRADVLDAAAGEAVAAGLVVAVPGTDARPAVLCVRTEVEAPDVGGGSREDLGREHRRSEGGGRCEGGKAFRSHHHHLIGSHLLHEAPPLITPKAVLLRSALLCGAAPAVS